MRKPKTALAIVALGAFAFSTVAASSPPPAPVTIILQPGDDLPQYDGDLDRVEIRAVPGSHVWVTQTWWPNDGLIYVAFGFRQRGEYHLEMDHPFIEGASLSLWNGIHWQTFSRWISYLDPDEEWGIPSYTWPERMVWPTEEMQDQDVHGQWWHPQNPVHQTTWEDTWTDAFEGTGTVALDWGSGFRGIARWRPDSGEHREPPTITAEENIEIEVTYYPR